MNEIAELVHKALDQRAVVENLECRLKEESKKLNEIEAELLPSAMESADVSKFETPDGITVTIKEDISMSFKSGDRDKAFSWLRKTGKDDLIRNVVSCEFGRGQDEHARALREILAQHKFEYVAREDINVASTKAVLRQSLEQGEDVPLDDFGAYQWKRAIVKIKK